MNATQNQPEELESVLVKTGLGQRLHPRNKRVYTHPKGEHVWRVCGDRSFGRFLLVSSMEDNYSRKTAGELEEGENLLLETEDIKARLSPEYLRSLSIRDTYGPIRTLQGIDFIDSLLTPIVEDELYVQAKNQLFVDAGDRTIPRFQYEMLTAAVNKGLIDQEVLERRLPEGRVMRSDIRDAVNYVFREYNELYKEEPETSYRTRNSTPKMTKSAFDSHFSGRNVSPKHLDTLLGLGVALDHEPLVDMYDDGLKVVEEGNCPPDVNTLWGARMFYDSERRKCLAEGTLYCEAVLDVKPLE